MSLGVPELIIVLAAGVSALLVVYPAARICQRIGYPRGLGLLAVVPFANIALLWFVAQSTWPVETGRRGPTRV